MALVVCGCHATADRQREPAPPRVVVVAAQRKTVPIVVYPIGTTRALEDVTIRARVKGFLKKKDFHDGGLVKPDEPLLVIDPVPFQLQVDQTEAQFQAAQAALAKALASKDREVAEAQVELDRAQVLLDQAEERRSRSLLARRALSQEDYDKADAQLKKSAAQLAADQAKLEQTRADYHINIDNARAQVAEAKAALKDARVNLSYTKMDAPIAGRIGELEVKVGNLVGDGSATELVSIQQLDPMGVDLRPPARYLPNATALLAQGLPVKLLVEGDRPHPYVGKAIFIDNTVDPTTSTFLVRAEVPNPEGSLLPGQYVRAEIIIGEYAGALLVPEQAVSETQEGSRVFVVDAKNRVEAAKVQPVDHYRGLRVLESGIEPGQRVIVEGIQLVRPGQPVEPTETPLEKYMRESQEPASLDRRFLSPISRLPGLSPGSSGPGEKAKGTTGEGQPATPTPAPKPETKER
jgi:membrane fusion protein (multidrug efflux system)